jgi:hypothetical protein
MAMNSLDKDWLTKGLIDFEYKKYVLLAYLQHVKGEFNDKKLYPFMSDLVFHYQNLIQLKENKQLIYENFPERITKADFEKLSLTYQKIIEDDNIMQQLEEIVEFSLPQFKQLLNEGKDIYEYVQENLDIQPVGVTPLRADEGYLFIRESTKPDTQVYLYQITIFENATEKFRGVHTTFIENFRNSIANTIENYKINLVKNNRELPNPGAYLIESRMYFPMNETLLPVAKRMLVRYLYAA